MKWGVCAVAATAMAIVACNVKSKDDINKETDQIIKDSQQRTDELMNSLYRGGQPGKITVKGIVVKKNGDQIQLDERLKVEQIGGKGNRGVSQTLVSEKNKAAFSETVEKKDLSALSASGKYINIGCEKLSGEEVGDLTEEKTTGLADAAVPLSAKKIFICGSHLNVYSFLSISAEELVLKEATVKLTALVGSLSISAVKLNLEGANVIFPPFSGHIFNETKSITKGAIYGQKRKTLLHSRV